MKSTAPLDRVLDEIRVLPCRSFKCSIQLPPYRRRSPINVFEVNYKAWATVIYMHWSEMGLGIIMCVYIDGMGRGRRWGGPLNDLVIKALLHNLLILITRLAAPLVYE